MSASEKDPPKASENMYEYQTAAAPQDIPKILQKLFTEFPDPLVLIDNQLHVKMLNRSAEQYYGIEKNENIIGQPCHRAFLEHQSPCKNCIVPAAVAAKQHVSFERAGCMTPDKLERVIIYPFENIDDQSGGALIRIQDITREKMLERQMIEREKLAGLGFMLSSISHDLASPANAISLNVPILEEYMEAMLAILDQRPGDQRELEIFHRPFAELKKDIRKILANVIHGSAIIQTRVSELRNFNKKKGAGREKTWLDVKRLAERVASLIRIEINQRVKSFQVCIPGGLPKIYANPDEIEQVLINLLINAARAADKRDSWVKLSAKTGTTWQEHLIIEVSDNGCGMDESVLKDIFKPFFSASEPETGTGLGLYICKRLVENLNGKIQVDSKAGEGSVFRVILPDSEKRSMTRL